MGLTARQLLPRSHEETVLTIRQPLPQSHPEIWKKGKGIFLALVVRITPVHLIVKCQRRIEKIQEAELVSSCN